MSGPRGIRSAAAPRPVEKLTRDIWVEIGVLLFGKDSLQWRFRCVSCGHSQCAQELMDRYGLKQTEAMNAAYYSCEGRLTANPGPGLKPEVEKHGCDWTLGGLFTIHRLAILDPETKSFRPVFAFDHPRAADLVTAASMSPRVHATTEARTWPEYEWPAWIPEATRTMVMSSHYPSPKAWLDDCARRDMPPLGEEVTVREKGEPFTGRVVYVKNDCVRIVNPAGLEQTAYL